MATIWVVEQGEYSDYRVVGVFSSKENVAAFANDAEHATKIANEHRTRLISSGDWDAALK